jgi:hypothetical protein
MMIQAEEPECANDVQLGRWGTSTSLLVYEQ